MFGRKRSGTAVEAAPPGTPMGVRATASQWARCAWKAHQDAERLGERHRFVHFASGILAVAAGVVAGTVGIAADEPVVTGVAGFTASALVGIQTTLDAPGLAQFHFSQAGGYGAMSRLFTNLAQDTAEPTRQQVDELVMRLGKWESRALGEPAPE